MHFKSKKIWLRARDWRIGFRVSARNLKSKESKIQTPKYETQEVNILYVDSFVVSGVRFFENVFSPKGWQNLWIFRMKQWLYPSPTCKLDATTAIDALKLVG